MKLAGLGFEVEQGWNVDSLGVDRLGVGSGGVVGQPGPVVVTTADRQFKFLFLDFYI